MMAMHEFIAAIPPLKEDLGYRAGRIFKQENRYSVGEWQVGAAMTFAVGMPVYDKDNNKLGYLEKWVCENLDIATEGPDEYHEVIPAMEWGVGKPTKHCVAGATVYTYWQRWNEYREADDESNF
jgi:hypothetical protein